MQFVRGGPDIPERLLQAHEDGRVVFFCGAGISYPARLPGFASLVDELYSHFAISPDLAQATAIKAKQYDTAVGLLEANTVDGRRLVREKIAEILSPDTSAPHATATHEALLTLAECRDHRLRLVTTNFDRLFEHVIANGHSVTERFAAPLLPVPKNRWDGLVYLHGLLPEESEGNNLDSLVVSSGDFGLAYLTERWAARFVSELLRNFVVCFVGYSINDPVLRYMMDALAADRLLGESTPEVFAFGSFSKGKERACAKEWHAKNVKPILYREHWHHAYLHRTLRTWADTYRDGAGGKERIVVDYAMARPDTATSQDDFVSRMLWALSDPSGLPAMRFADLDPVPSLDWLEPIGEDRFRHADLIRFGVPPKATEDKNLKFSLARRPAPYDLATPMVLADATANDSRYDRVMFHLTRWLIRHLNNPSLLLWLIKQGGTPHRELSSRITARLDTLADLEQTGKVRELRDIRANAPDAIPDARMRTLWRLVLSRRVSLVGDVKLYEWRQRFVRDGLTATLRLELCEMLTPRVSLRAPFRWPSGDGQDDDVTADMSQLVDWDIVLSDGHVYAHLQGWDNDERWRQALPALLPDFTKLLHDALDLMRELGGADEKSDLSYSSQPSISEHPQNSDFPDWTVLIDLNRDAWLLTATKSAEQARRMAEAWSQIPYPLFRRLAFFAATRDEVVPCTQGLAWLLADENWWLWSIETQRETLRLLVALAPQLDGDERERLERAILAGPPRDMYRPDLEQARWIRIQESDVWLRLAKINQTGTNLSVAARARFNELSTKHPNWQLAENERDEFPTWRGDGSELRVHVTTPRDQGKLIEWLRNNPEPDHWRPNDWHDRCRDDFEDAASALIELARENTWPAGRWREALQRWSESELTEPSWSKIAPVLANVPETTLQELAHGVSWWLEKVARTFEGHEGTFLSLCDRILALDYDFEEGDDDLLNLALNHPIGNVTEALLHWWYRKDLEDERGLADEPRHRFTQLCDTTTPSFRYGRVLLAVHVISLFRVDREWTIQFMLPLFQWEISEAEARAAWSGFLWSPRLYGPLMEVLKPAFLDTANHYFQLGDRLGEQYASLLTFVALDRGDIYRINELALATRTLPQRALEHTAQTLFRAVDSAGDQRPQYWTNRVVPYLRSIWPKTPDVISETVSENFGRLCIATRDAFPDALGQLRSWFQPIEFPEHIAHLLHEAKLETQFPESSLELLHLFVSDESQAYFLSLPACLNAIRATQAELEHDHRFQRLVAILRANGGDLA